MNDKSYKNMKNLNLYRIWEVMNKLSNKQDELAEDSVYVSLLGVMSNYTQTSFEHFLEYYSFGVLIDYISVFNDDAVAWQAFNNNDFSDVPIKLLEMSEEDLGVWMDDEVKRQVAESEKHKLREKENIKEQIERLQKQLEL